MILHPTPYQNEYDLKAMRQLVASGRQAGNGTYYVHTGDLNWWFTYYLPGHDPREHTWLWYGPGGSLDGFTLFAPDWDAVDVFVRPELCGTSQAADMWAWGIENAVRLIQQKGEELGITRIVTMWIAQDDAWLNNLLGGIGFKPGKSATVCMTRSIPAVLPEPALPAGFEVCRVEPTRDLATRAAAQFAAFESELPFDQYLDRFRRFTQDPCYSQNFDLMIATPDRRAAAFCMCWLDPLNRTGAFEPVGTHPDFQRMGLGKAIMLAGLRQMQACGMQSAQVCTGADHLPAVRMYESAGFSIQRNLVHHVLPVL